MGKTFLLLAFLTLGTKGHSQFNTVKKNLNLSKVEVDTIDKVEEAPIALLDECWQGKTDESKWKPGPAVSMPLSSPLINSAYGNRIDPLTGKVKFHHGIDFKGSADSVMVIMAGEVKEVAYSLGFGNYVEVQHGDFSTIYGHLSLVMIRDGIKVRAGTVIGLTGNTGRSTGDHLHFGLKHKGKTMDPTRFLDLIYNYKELKHLVTKQN